MITIVWFRNDLRLGDNPALCQALADSEVIVPVYIFEPDLSPSLGAGSSWWLHHSLVALGSQLDKKHSQLVLRRGDPYQVLSRLQRSVGAERIYWNSRYEPDGIKRDNDLKSVLEHQGTIVKTFNGALLYPLSKKFFQVFTPFWQHCLKLPEPARPLAEPELIPGLLDLPSDELNKWNLLPKGEDKKSEALAAYWQPGSVGAEKKFALFLQEELARYSTGRDFPDLSCTSGLSPHLHFGEISARKIWHALRDHAKEYKIPTPSLDTFHKELGWREFFYNLLYNFPDLAQKPFKEKFAKFPYHDDPQGLEAWQQGRTGYPIVDAGMRELWHSGYMHNRVRMITASFLTKDLLIDWRAGAQWFWQHLVDADLANNCANWQWVAGCGADAAPYFRIFNPVLQGTKFDPEGAYVRRWVPELGSLPAKYIHAPWQAPESVLMQAGVTLGKSYPRPIIDHAYARERALINFRNS